MMIDKETLNESITISRGKTLGYYSNGVFRLEHKHLIKKHYKYIVYDVKTDQPLIGVIFSSSITDKQLITKVKEFINYLHAKYPLKNI